MSPSTSGRTLMVLAFHKIGEPPSREHGSWFYVPEATFISYLRHLRDNDWQVIDLAAFLKGIAAPASLPERAALITFDDGYRLNLATALPWLRRFGYPAVIFVPTDFIGGRNGFDAGVEPDEAICDWDDLRALERAGISVQSHGVTHQAFSRLNLAEKEDELCQSKFLLEAGLGNRVEAFSYPYGDPGVNQEAVGDTLRRAGYRAAFLYGGGHNQLPLANPYLITRIAMGPDNNFSATMSQTALKGDTP